MSGHSDGCECPNCGANSDRYTDWKPFDYTSITCYDCGLQIYPELTYMTLEELNETREEQEMEKINKLPEQSNNIW